VYNHLYNQKEDHNKALNKEKNDYERRFHHDYPFHPEIYHKSVTLSAHSRRRRDSIENMIRDETLGKVTPIKEKITRRASVWKTLEADFPLYQPDTEPNKNESNLFIKHKIYYISVLVLILNNSSSSSSFSFSFYFSFCFSSY